MIDWSSLDVELDRQRDAAQNPRTHDELVEEALDLLELKFDISTMDSKYKKQETSKWKTRKQWEIWDNRMPW